MTEDDRQKLLRGLRRSRWLAEFAMLSSAFSCGFSLAVWLGY